MGCCVSTPPDNIENHIENHNVKTNNNSKSDAITNDKNIEIVYNDNTTDSKPKEQNTTTITNKNDIQIVYNNIDEQLQTTTKTDENKPPIIAVTNTQNTTTNNPSSPYSPINDTIDITADEDKIQQQIKLEQQELEQKFQQEANTHFRNATFETQLKQQQSQHFDSLHTVWNKYATNESKTKMNMKSLCNALEVFGIVLDGDANLQRSVFKTFDSDNNKRWIDYNDFSSTMSSIVASKTDESLYLLFQVFDIDKDGFLDVADFARILLTQNQIALVTTGLQEDSTTVIYSKKQCMKQAENMIRINNNKVSNTLSDTKNVKVSFEQFKNIMVNRTDYEMIIDHMKQPSLSFKLSDENIRHLSVWHN